jgi:hypothetical protein
MLKHVFQLEILKIRREMVTVVLDYPRKDTTIERPRIMANIRRGRDLNIQKRRNLNLQREEFKVSELNQSLMSIIDSITIVMCLLFNGLKVSVQLEDVFTILTRVKFSTFMVYGQIVPEDQAMDLSIVRRPR